MSCLPGRTQLLQLIKGGSSCSSKLQGFPPGLVLDTILYSLYTEIH